MEVILDNELPQVKPTKNLTLESLTATLAGSKQKTVRTEIHGSVFHKNYLEYLANSWNNHYGIIISPDILWYNILCELAGHIKGNAEQYRSLFTTSNSKTEIRVPTADPQLIDLNLIANELSRLVPTNTDAFLLRFSTTNEHAALAFKAAFADAMTPYYNYSMFMCGLPRVKILGTPEDWDIITNTLIDFLRLFEPLQDYLSGLIVIMKQIKGCLTEPDVTFLKDIFRLERCGSGGQVEVAGWITKFYTQKPRLGYVGNYNSAVSKVPYTFLETGQEFVLNYGLFSSNLDGHYLVPEFGFTINENVTGTTPITNSNELRERTVTKEYVDTLIREGL